MPRWYDDDHFWRDLQPVLFTPARWENADREVEQIVSLLKPPPGSAVLDMGCGAGRHALAFARRGYSVTGVDRTAAYLEAARERAQCEQLAVQFVRADMREFRGEGGFDLAISMLTAFGYFDDPQEDLRVIENLHASLRPGGCLVIDLMGKEVLARIFRERDWHAELDGTLLLEERSVSADWSWLDLRWMIVREGRTSEHRFRLRLYAASELLGLLTEAGFTQVRAYGSLAGAPYDHAAERLIVVGRSPEP